MNTGKSRVRWVCRVAGLVLLCLALISCGDASLVSYDGGASSRAQQITLIPEFSIIGASSMPGVLQFSELGLSISEIRLEPMAPKNGALEAGAIAYSTRRPIHLRFDVGSGETIIYGEPLDLPRTGRYLISVRLEPAARVEKTSAGMTEMNIPSLSVEGFVSADGSYLNTSRIDETADGSPVPMPFDKNNANCDDNKCAPWMPFHYDSRRPAFITLNEVNIDRKSEFLAFEFDVEEWAETLVAPLRSAAKDYDSTESPTNTHGMDVTNRLESTGVGAETLFRNTSVRSIAQVR